MADCFGGIACGALPCLLKGVNWVGVELEQHFVALGEQNLAYWQQRYGHRMQGAQARLVQGDSRELCAVVQEAVGCCVSSPPFQDTNAKKVTGIDPAKHQSKPCGPHSMSASNGYGHTPGNLGNLPAGSVEAALTAQLACCLSSPPYNLPMSQDHNGTRGGTRGTTAAETGAFYRYGNTPGQLEGLPSGSIETVISSPPYADRCANDAQRTLHRNGPPPGHNEGDGATYGQTPGNLGNLPAGEVSAVLSSPPYCEGLGKEHTYQDHAKRDKPSHRRIMTEKGIVDPHYGTTPGNLGNLASGEVAAVINREEICEKPLKIEGFSLASTQNPDRMLCSEHNILPGDSVWQSVKTAGQVYHAEHDGACPVEASNAANLSQPATPVDALSAARRRCAAPVGRSKTAKPLKGKSSPQNTDASSALATLESISPQKPRPNCVLHNCAVPSSLPLTEVSGEALPSKVSAKTSSDETIMPASNVEQRGEGSLFTTSKTLKPLEASGIIPKTTSRRSVDDAISACTCNKSGPASSVALHTSVTISDNLSVPQPINGRDVIGSTVPAGPNGMPDTFWSASKQILQQVFDLLKPGGVAIWVVKNYVRDGKIVPFSPQWKMLCEHVGFITLHEHHALLSTQHGVEQDLFGGEDVVRETRRISFFRRNNEKKGAPRIDYETILCCVKPG